MPTYAILLHPAANRVYTDAAARLMTAELGVLDRSVLGGRLSGIEQTAIGGIPYLTFTAEPLSETETGLLANLSAAYALFRVEGDLLAPVGLHRLDRYDDDLVTIQKYQGKTNEQFTKLLLNVTLWSCAHGAGMLDRRFHVLDPLCGRGTTLNQALMYGYDATGIDLDKRDFEAYSGFVRTYLKRKRLKHQADITQIRRNKRVLGKQFTAVMAPTKQDFKDGRTQRLEYANVDTAEARPVYAAQSFDLVVADAPYGVQHGSRTDKEGLKRGPQGLIGAAAPVWAELLRPGGAVGISWNNLVAGRAELAEALTAAGLEVCEDEPYLGFEHRVDQAIVRDLVVARKP